VRAAGLPPDTPLMAAVVDEHARCDFVVRKWNFKIHNMLPRRDAAPSAMEVLGGRTTSLGNARVTYPEPRVRPPVAPFATTLAQGSAEPCCWRSAAMLPHKLQPANLVSRAYTRQRLKPSA